MTERIKMLEQCLSVLAGDRESIAEVLDATGTEWEGYAAYVSRGGQRDYGEWIHDLLMPLARKAAVEWLSQNVVLKEP